MITKHHMAVVPVWGCVLIGGQSRRMGSPKHLLQQDGVTWIERTVSILRPKVEQVVIAGAGHLPASLAGERRVDDVPEIGGPLAGILAAFRRYPQVSWLVAACDLPDMQDGALQWLLDCRRPGVLAVMPDLAADGRIEPLLAYYDRACRQLLEKMAADAQPRMNRLREAEGVITPQPPFPVRISWRNVNTPQDLNHPWPAVNHPAVKTKEKTDNSSKKRKG
jgi:molybdopterin-guanine dinucleotide biosynthesis protein A